MTGLRKRTATGFLSIVCLLFLSGMISLFELGRLSRDSGEILDASRRNIDRAKEMLDAAHDHSVSLIRISVFGDRSYDSLCLGSMERLEQVLSIAQDEAVDRSILDSLAFAATELRLLTDDFLARRDAADAADTLRAVSDTLAVRAYAPSRISPDWYLTEYEAIHGRLTEAINSYMASTQSSLAPQAEQLKKNAYRAVTPVLISLVVMIAIVLMLYYFINVYCVGPIIRMNKSLGDYLAFRVPFAVKGECRDEVLGLREKIETLITMLRQTNKS